MAKKLKPGEYLPGLKLTSMERTVEKVALLLFLEEVKGAVKQVDFTGYRERHFRINFMADAAVYMAVRAGESNWRIPGKPDFNAKMKRLLAKIKAERSRKKKRGKIRKDKNVTQ